MAKVEDGGRCSDTRTAWWKGKELWFYGVHGRKKGGAERLLPLHSRCSNWASAVRMSEQKRAPLTFFLHLQSFLQRLLVQRRRALCFLMVLVMITRFNALRLKL
ncbi:uncharacterized protein LOC111240942 [Vigna radiata var. radiata]|uniref:Uncharacterized protein LOC111240942 n=1 Tax=Vigna radiata var. radiata TaxID=3916 RepID=A0A3Q0EQT4_VIGRR|nr:uncharacterized protein LOC111240942 [Vigna radiata var. radiata]